MVFTPLGFILLVIGPMVALTALWRPYMLGMGAAWIVAVAAIAVMDALISRALARLEVRRVLDDPLSLDAANPVRLEFRSRCPLALDLLVYDDVPLDLRPSGNMARLRLPAFGRRTVRYTVRPRRRGRIELGDVYVRGLALLRLSRWQKRMPAAAHVRIYPSLLHIRRYDYLARARRLREEGYRIVRRLGAGREFESLREYMPDDDFRDIDWKATARRDRPITRQYQVERSQHLMLVLDCGRAMAAETDGLTKLDHAVNAALMLAHVATAMDDAVGWLAFSDRILRLAPPRKSPEQVSRLADELYELQVELVEPDYPTAFATLKSRLRKRALVVIFTDVLDLEASDRLVAYTASLCPRHLPLLIAIRDAELEELADTVPRREEEAHVAAVATRLLERRQLALAAMRHRGALVLDLAPQQITTEAVSEYLSVKAAGRL